LPGWFFSLGLRAYPLFGIGFARDGSMKKTFQALEPILQREACMIGPTFLVITVMAILFYGISRLNYLVDDQYLRIRLGPIPFRKFAIGDIRDARVGFSHWAESWTNTIYPPTISRKGVTIYRKSGSFRKVLITPDDPAEFVEEIKKHPRFVPSPL